MGVPVCVQRIEKMKILGFFQKGIPGFD